MNSPCGMLQMLELALLGKWIQREVERVQTSLTWDDKSSVNLAPQGHCTEVFLGTRVATRPLLKTFMPSSTRSIPRIFPRERVTACHYRKGYYRRRPITCLSARGLS
jgi:hypothetical protein